MTTVFVEQPLALHGSAKGDAENSIHNTLSKPFSQLTRDQQGSAYNHSFITFIKIYGCKETYMLVSCMLKKWL